METIVHSNRAYHPTMFQGGSRRSRRRISRRSRARITKRTKTHRKTQIKSYRRK